MTAPTPYPDDMPAARPLREVAAEPAPAAEPGLPTENMRIELEDGTQLTVRTTNRDFLRWDRTPAGRRGGSKNFQETPFVFATFLGWSAAQRAGLTDLSFDAFADAVVDLERLDGEEVPPTP